MMRSASCTRPLHVPRRHLHTLAFTLAFTVRGGAVHPGGVVLKAALLAQAGDRVVASALDRKLNLQGAEGAERSHAYTYSLGLGDGIKAATCMVT